MTTQLATTDRVIIVVRNATDRDRLFPEPDLFQAVFQLDTNSIIQWGGAAWDVAIPGLGPLSFEGTGSPEGAVTAGVGATYQQTDGLYGAVLWVKLSGAGNTGWTRVSVDDGRANAQRFLGKLTRNAEDASLMLISDSTGTATYWSPIFFAGLAARFPAYTVVTRTWSTGTDSYGSPVTIQTGTGDFTLTIYNMSISGANTATFLVPHFQTMIADVQPDYAFISLGHNEGAIARQWAPQYLELVVSVVQACPDTAFCVVAQNPAEADTNMELRAAIYADIAAAYGFGFIDICAIFNQNGGAAALDIDGVHPNPAGSALWAASVLQAFHYSNTGNVQPGTLPWTNVADELLVNGDFSNFTGSVPAGWVIGGGATVTKNVTEYESPNGWSVKVQTAGAAGTIQQSIDGRRVAGRWVTLIAREYVEDGQPTTSGELGLYDGVGSSNFSRFSFEQGAFRWVVWQMYVDPACTTLTVLLYGDRGATSGAASFDRVSLRIGRYPMLGAQGGAVAASRVQPGDFAPGGPWKFGSATGGFLSVLFDAAASTVRQLVFAAAGVGHWVIQATATGGDNFSLIALDDAGATIDSVYSVTRAANGPATMARSLTAKATGAQHSADNGNASATLNWGTAQGVQVWNTVLTATRAISLATAGMTNGGSYVILRTAAATGNFGLQVGSGPLITLWPGEWCRVTYNGSAFVLAEFGRLSTSQRWAAKTGDYTLLDLDDGLFLGGTAHTLTLQSAATRLRPLVLRNVASGIWAITRAGSDTVEGATSINLAPGEAITLMPNGTDWLIVG